MTSCCTGEQTCILSPFSGCWPDVNCKTRSSHEIQSTGQKRGKSCESMSFCNSDIKRSTSGCFGPAPGVKRWWPSHPSTDQALANRLHICWVYANRMLLGHYVIWTYYWSRARGSLQQKWIDNIGVSLTSLTSLEATRLAEERCGNFIIIASALKDRWNRWFILYCLKDIVRFLSKAADFKPPPRILITPITADPVRISPIFGTRKRESLGHCVALFA